MYDKCYYVSYRLNANREWVPESLRQRSSSDICKSKLELDDRSCIGCLAVRLHAGLFSHST